VKGAGLSAFLVLAALWFSSLLSRVQQGDEPGPSIGMVSVNRDLAVVVFDDRTLGTVNLLNPTVAC